MVCPMVVAMRIGTPYAVDGSRIIRLHRHRFEGAQLPVPNRQSHRSAAQLDRCMRSLMQAGHGQIDASAPAKSAYPSPTPTAPSEGSADVLR
jgi:hypothetical protein